MEIKRRPDLDPQARGTNTSPNVHRRPTHYEVVGLTLDFVPLGEGDRAWIVSWLGENKPDLVPGIRHGNYGTTTEVELYHVNGTWILVDYFSYSGG